MLRYLSVVFLSLISSSAAVETLSGSDCEVRAGNNQWTFTNGVIFNCVVKSATGEGQALDIIVDGTLEFNQNIGDPDFPITNLRITRNLQGQPLTGKVSGDIITSGDQNLQIDLEFTLSGDQKLVAQGVINLEGDLTKTTTGSLTAQTSQTGAITILKSLSVTDNLILQGNSLQFHGPSLTSVNGNIDLNGEMLFRGAIPQSITCSNGILTAMSFTKDSSLSGKVTFEASQLAGDSQTAAGIRLSPPGGITVQTSEGMEIKSPITTPGSIDCSGGPLTIGDIQLIGIAGSGQNIRSYTTLVVGDITQVQNTASLTLDGPDGITAGDIRVPGELTVESTISLNQLIAGRAIFKQSMSIASDVNTDLGFMCQADVTLTKPGAGTQTVHGGDTLDITGNVLRATGDLALRGTHVTVRGNVVVTEGLLRIDAVGAEPNAQLAKDVTAVGITFEGPCLLSSTSTQTLDAGSGGFVVQPSLSKDRGDLIVKGYNFDIVGDLTANSGSLTIAGNPTSFQCSGNILAGVTLQLPPCQLVLVGSQPQSVQANIKLNGFGGRLEAPSPIYKTVTGPLSLSGTYVELADEVIVSDGGLTIMGRITALGKLKATGTVDLDDGEVSGDIEGRDITVKGQINLVGTGNQRFYAPQGSVYCMSTVTKTQGDFSIRGASSVTLDNDVIINTGELEISSNSEAKIQGNLDAASMILSPILLLGSSQQIKSPDIVAQAMTKASGGDLTIKTSARLRLNGLWSTTHPQTSIVFDKISFTDTPSFSSNSNIQCEKDITIKYPLTLDGSSDQRLSSAGYLKCKDLVKNVASCSIVGPSGIEVLEDSGSGINIFGDFTIEGPFTSDVTAISASAFALRGSCTLTRADTQTITATSLGLGETASNGGITKSSGDLSIVLSGSVILHGDISVPAGVFDIRGKSATVHSSSIVASSINFHGFTGNVINLVVEIGAGDTKQVLRATGGKLQLDSQLSKNNGLLELEGQGGIHIDGDISAGDLLVKSFLQSSAGSIVVMQNMEFMDAVVLDNTGRTEMNVGDFSVGNQLIVHKSITKATGDLIFLNRLGTILLHGDITLSSGSLEFNGKIFIDGNLAATTRMEFKATVVLQGSGSQQLKSKNVRFVGEEPVSVTKSNGALSLGESSDPTSKVFFSGTGSLSVWNGSLTVSGLLTIEQNVWADYDVTLDDVTMTGLNQQSIISIQDEGCLLIHGKLIKDTNHLVVGKDCITLGTITDAKNGRLVRCGPSAPDPCQTSTCKCTNPSDPTGQAPCVSIASSCPGDNRPTRSPTNFPTTAAPTMPGETLSPTSSPVTKSPTKFGETRSPTKMQVNTRSPTPKAGGAAAAGGSPTSSTVIGIIVVVVVLAIPGIAILIWLCVRNKRSFGDTEVLLSEDVGEYQAPNA